MTANLDGSDTVPEADWNDEKHVETAEVLSRGFDANYGTNWDRLRDAQSK